MNYIDFTNFNEDFKKYEGDGYVSDEILDFVWNMRFEYFMETDALDEILTKKN